MTKNGDGSALTSDLNLRISSEPYHTACISGYWSPGQTSSVCLGMGTKSLLSGSCFQIKVLPRVSKSEKWVMLEIKTVWKQPLFQNGNESLVGLHVCVWYRFSGVH